MIPRYGSDFAIHRQSINLSEPREKPPVRPAAEVLSRKIFGNLVERDIEAIAEH
jgi:hypothetical protein